MWGNIAIAFLLAFIVTFMATPYTIKLAEKVGAVDVPKDKRRMHKKAMENKIPEKLMQKILLIRVMAKNAVNSSVQSPILIFPSKPSCDRTRMTTIPIKIIPHIVLVCFFFIDIPLFF